MIYLEWVQPMKDIGVFASFRPFDWRFTIFFKSFSYGLLVINVGPFGMHATWPWPVACHREKK